MHYLEQTYTKKVSHCLSEIQISGCSISYLAALFKWTLTKHSFNGHSICPQSYKGKSVEHILCHTRQ